MRRPEVLMLLVPKSKQAPKGLSTVLSHSFIKCGSSFRLPGKKNCLQLSDKCTSALDDGVASLREERERVDNDFLARVKKGRVRLCCTADRV